MRKIKEILNETAETEHVTIIYACESGSRAWGFESTNSDYDVRFIYVRPLSSYITIRDRASCIDKKNGSPDILKKIFHWDKTYEIDISGWDIIKVMYLIAKGNPTIAEWLQSPIVYANTDGPFNQLKKSSEEYYRSKNSIYHYEHMARGNFNQYIKNIDGVIAKKYLYVLRPIYACEWALRHGTAPPMLFEQLYTDGAILQNADFKALLPELLSLIEKKKSGQELGKGPHIPVIDEICKKLLDGYVDYCRNLINKDKDYGPLDKLLNEIIRKNQPS